MRFLDAVTQWFAMLVVWWLYKIIMSENAQHLSLHDFIILSNGCDLTSKSPKYTGHFIMLSVITNIYNKKTKESTLMELFTATGKLKKYFFDN
jgi:hypothetical protein